MYFEGYFREFHVLRPYSQVKKDNYSLKLEQKEDLLLSEEELSYIRNQEFVELVLPLDWKNIEIAADG